MCVQIHLFGADMNIQFLLLAVSFGLWGATFGMGSAVVEAIFADSTPTGAESRERECIMRLLMEKQSLATRTTASFSCPPRRRTYMLS